MLVRKLPKTRSLVVIMRSVEVQPGAVMPKDPVEIITPVGNSRPDVMLKFE